MTNSFEIWDLLVPSTQNGNNDFSVWDAGDPFSDTQLRASFYDNFDYWNKNSPYVATGNVEFDFWNYESVYTDISSGSVTPDPVPEPPPTPPPIVLPRRRTFSYQFMHFVRASSAPPPTVSLVYDMDGSTYVRFTGGGATANPTEYTIAAWLRPTASANACVVVRSGGDPSSGWSHSIEQRTTGWRSYTFTGGGAVTCQTAVAPTLNAWTHVVGTAKNSDFLRLYLNGLSAAAPVAMGALWTGGNDWWACRASGGAPSNFTGQIAELTIWNKQLTDLEIYNLASGARGLSSSIQAANIIAYCQMNDAADGVTLVGNWGEYTGTLTQTRTGAPIGKNLDLPIRSNTLPTTNLIANWKADAISASNNDILDAWPDSSGNGWHLTQTNATYKPVYKTSQINSLPAVRFDTQYFDAPDFTVGLTAAEVFGVVIIDTDPPAAAGNTGLWQFGGTGERMHYPWTDGTVYDNFFTTVRKTTVNPTPSLASWRLYNTYAATNAWRSYLDGTQIYDTASNTFTVSGNRCVGKGADAFYLKGYIAEIAMYSAVLTADQRMAVKAYFASKYNLTSVSLASL